MQGDGSVSLVVSAINHPRPISAVPAATATTTSKATAATTSSSATWGRTTSSATAPDLFGLRLPRATWPIGDGHHSSAAPARTSPAITTATPPRQGHARDADVILGDNGNIYRLVGTNGASSGDFLTFTYDNYGSLKDHPARVQAARLHARRRRRATAAADDLGLRRIRRRHASTARRATMSSTATARMTTSTAAPAWTGSSAARAKTASSATTARSTPAATG